MDEALLGVVVDRLARHPLGGSAEGALLAAFETDESLEAELDGRAAGQNSPGQKAEVTPGPAGAYLRSLTVSGFRGIGQPAKLTVHPGPGLTVVVGRNGSGKSSFAEALEVLLTGNLKRWEKPTPVIWIQGWRNLHQREQAEICGDFLVEGAGATTVQRTWSAAADFSGSSVFVQVAGEKRAELERLGWSEDLVNFRPFLSHKELEAFFGTPSSLYELLASVLGLEELTSAARRLADARKSREAAYDDVKKHKLPGLLRQLRDSSDERAATCLTALSGRTWDLTTAQQAASGIRSTKDGGELNRLLHLAHLVVPEDSDIRAAAAGLLAAADGLDAIAGSSADRARALAALLSAALQHHSVHGDGDCPVCGRSGALTSRWREDTEREIAQLKEQARAADSAAHAGQEARRCALALVQPAPPVLSEKLPSGLDPRPARKAWQDWAGPLDSGVQLTAAGLRGLAAHLGQAAEPLTLAVGALSDQAAAQYSERQDAWAPLAEAVSSWCSAAGKAQDGMVVVVSIKAAEQWLKSATDDVRNERLAPLADQARSIWAMLRQESNVDLGAIRLAGSSTQRRVELDVSVDGVTGSALGVMSQGEVNALALSVFLPRASLPASPFRFLVIDDPVQAMDPAKVDGLARVLKKAATDRQLIVFTHDNRLPQAIRQLKIPATVLEVTRQPGSAVTVRPCQDPSRQALQDAGALAADPSVPLDLAARVIPGFCRTAVEAAFTQVVWRRELAAGRRHSEIESDLVDASVRLNRLAALALNGDADKGGDVLRRLNSWGRRYADTYQALNKGAHVAHAGDLGALVRDSRDLVDKIRASQP
jgi:recombinational DNA repair ATPase RecF